MTELRPSDLAELLAFEAVEPGGALRDDLRAGMIALIFASGFMKKKGGGGFGLEDFMLDFDNRKSDASNLSRRLRAALNTASASKTKLNKKGK